MRLADRIAQCRTPYVVMDTKDGTVTQLNSATAFSKEIASCAVRYVLSDELTRLCTALAYSKGASSLACADLLHVPAERVWVEWTEAPWRSELARYGFKCPADSTQLGRRGTFIQSTPQGRTGLGTLAVDIPVLLTFFLLLATRPRLPCRPLMLERLNKARSKSGKTRLLEQIEVFAPLMPEYRSDRISQSEPSRRPRRLHQVRGHLVRRGSLLYWRVPHMRGSKQAGTIRTRTDGDLAHRPTGTRRPHQRWVGGID